MTIWTNLEKALGEARRRTIGAVFEAISTARARREEAAFSVALIALSAKLAKADGVVTDDEIAAFQAFFSFPPEEAEKVRTVYQLAQQDVAGFDHYLERVARLFEDDPAVLEDVLDCLYHVALADGVAHPREMELLNRAGAVFRLSACAVRRVKVAHMGLDDEDPYAVLGVECDIDATRLKTRYHELMRENHPDALVARGVPAELVSIGEGRTAAVNAAYEKILAERAAEAR